MATSAEDYRSAALEHLASARWLHEQGRYYLAHYLSGLSVECLLRGYLRRVSKEFEGRHDLQELARYARFFDLIPPTLHAQFETRLAELNRRWRSNHRYLDERKLWSYLSELKADFNIKGDRRKNHSRAALTLAAEIVKLGELKWKSQQNRT